MTLEGDYPRRNCRRPRRRRRCRSVSARHHRSRTRAAYSYVCVDVPTVAVLWFATRGSNTIQVKNMAPVAKSEGRTGGVSLGCGTLCNLNITLPLGELGKDKTS